jgi:GH35 family endo-1,4-beta-xylanase
MNASLQKVILAALMTALGTTEISAQTDTVQTNVPALKSVYAGDFRIGCLLSYRNIGFPSDPYVPGQSAVVTPNGGYLIKYHMNIMTPGNNMKPQYTVDIASSAAAYVAASTQQEKDSIDTHPVVKFNGDMIAQLNWAQRQGFSFRGHTLVWHNQTPAAFFYSGYSTSGTRLTKSAMTARLEHYIEEIIRLLHESWPGLLSAIDIVNEAVNDNGTFRTAGNDWYTTFGDTTYLMKAFEFARFYTQQYGENQIKLYYNDYNTHLAAKADEIVRVLTPIYQAGYLDGIGMQEHDALSTPVASDWVASYDKFAPICSEMAVTEFDVATGSANPSARFLTTQANQYAWLFKCFVERSYFSGRGKIICVAKDGLNDQYTFQANQSSSLWDAFNQCKPAFYSVAAVGEHYHSLDSLIAYADTLSSAPYTPDSWTVLTQVLSLAKNDRDQNYSNTLPADSGLAMGRDTLQAAIDALVPLSTGVTAVQGNIPVRFELEQNYPNPFNPTTLIRYSIPGLRGEESGSSTVRLAVYDVTGRVVADLVNERQYPGTYAVSFDATHLSSGIYLCRLVAGGLTASRKLLYLK